MRQAAKVRAARARFRLAHSAGISRIGRPTPPHSAVGRPRRYRRRHPSAGRGDRTHASSHAAGRPGRHRHRSRHHPATVEGGSGIRPATRAGACAAGPARSRHPGRSRAARPPDRRRTVDVRPRALHRTRRWTTPPAVGRGGNPRHGHQHRRCRRSRGSPRSCLRAGGQAECQAQPRSTRLDHRRPRDASSRR